MSTALQNALAAISAADSQSLVAAKCRGLMHGYDARWRNAGYQPVAVEQVYRARLTNPETGKDSRTYTLAMKLDVLTEQNGQRVLFDHKSTSEGIEDPDSPYWRQLVVEGQVSHYLLILWQNGIKCDGAVWDVMRKPQTSPKKLTKAEMKAVASLNKYFDRDVTIDDPVTWDGRETLAMYEARLAYDCTRERPQHYFQRRSVPRLDAELLEYAGELWDIGQEMLSVRNSGRNTRNSGACMLYGSPCKFLGICSGYDTPDSDQWVRKQQVHVELPLEGDGRDVITNSRIRCFQTCRRKHYYQYELGIERHDEEEKEALYFGHLWHLALEAWWKTFLQEV